MAKFFTELREKVVDQFGGSGEHMMGDYSDDKLANEEGNRLISIDTKFERRVDRYTSKALSHLQQFEVFFD
jgi:hypothetical protein